MGAIQTLQKGSRRLPPKSLLQVPSTQAGRLDVETLPFALGAEHFPPVGSQRSIRRDVPVERLPRDPQFLTKRADFSLPTPHARHGES